MGGIFKMTDEITCPHEIIKVGDTFVLEVKVYGLYYVTYSSTSLELLSITRIIKDFSK